MIRMHIFDYRFLRDSSVDSDVVMRGWMSSSYWSRNGMATPRRELVMAFDHSVIYARDPKESKLDEVRKHYTRFVKMWLRIGK